MKTFWKIHVEQHENSFWLKLHTGFWIIQEKLQFLLVFSYWVASL